MTSQSRRKRYSVPVPTSSLTDICRRITEVSDVPAKKAAAVVEAKVKAGVQPVAPAPVADKKRKADAAETSAADISMTSTDGLSKNQKKKLAKKAKTEPEAAAPAPKKDAAPAAKSGKVRKA